MSAEALLIGVTRFSDPQLSGLQAPRSDVEALQTVLADPLRGGFKVVTSIDESLLAVRDKLSSLLDDRHPSDLVLLYYSGHGIVDRARSLFLCTGDTRVDRPRARSLPAAEIREMMEQSRAGKIVIVLDCCHSGVFTEGVKGRKDAAITDATFDPGEGAEGHYVLTATNAIQFALDAGPFSDTDKGGRTTLSHFTSWLVDGIGRAEAAPDKPFITLDDLYTYLCLRARQSGAMMTPQRYVKRNSGDMVIARNPAAQPARIPTDLLAKFNVPAWSIRQDAVTELMDLVSKRPKLRSAARKLLRDRMITERDRDVFEAMMVAFVECQLTAADLRNFPEGLEGQHNTAPVRSAAIEAEREGSSRDQQQIAPLAKVPDISESRLINKEIEARRAQKQLKRKQLDEQNRERDKNTKRDEAMAVEREWVRWMREQAENESQRAHADAILDTGAHVGAAEKQRDSEVATQIGEGVVWHRLSPLVLCTLIVGGAIAFALSKKGVVPEPMLLMSVLTFFGSTLFARRFMSDILWASCVAALLSTTTISLSVLWLSGSMDIGESSVCLVLSFTCAAIFLALYKLWRWRKKS